MSKTNFENDGMKENAKSNDSQNKHLQAQLITYIHTYTHI